MEASWKLTTYDFQAYDLTYEPPLQYHLEGCYLYKNYLLLVNSLKYVDISCFKISLNLNNNYFLWYFQIT